MTRTRPLFRTVRADGAACTLSFAEDDTWTIRLDEELIETGRTMGAGVEQAVDRFKALSSGALPRRLAAAS